uniref:Uncharacterized protein n=1 Tax=Amphimedon queenslandica TaxID=400682 RepID=A0A1X7T778_AMPQE
MAPSITAEVTMKIGRQIFSNHGLPERFISHNGLQGMTSMNSRNKMAFTILSLIHTTLNPMD